MVSKNGQIFGVQARRQGMQGGAERRDVEAGVAVTFQAQGSSAARRQHAAAARRAACAGLL